MLHCHMTAAAFSSAPTLPGALPDHPDATVDTDRLLAALWTAAPVALLLLDDERVVLTNRRVHALIPALQVGDRFDIPADWRRIGLGQDYRVGTAAGEVMVTLRWLSAPGDRQQLLEIDDITADWQSRAQDERQQRLAAMGRMTAELAHQLRTPLCTASLYASQLRHDRLDAAEHDRIADHLVQQLGQLDALITRMLGFVRTQSAAHEVGPIEPVLREQLMVIAPQLARQRIGLAVGWRAEGCLVAHDRLQLGSALMALLENALQHSPPNSTLTVSCTHEGHRVLIRVGDEGPGIPAHLAPSLFEPFVTGRAAGNGLGLAIARAAAAAHGGELCFSPRQPCGALFTLTLPALAPV
jgi:two-component system sensor histidine kinase FlrB